MAMKMRRSLAELEREFLYETQRARNRSVHLRRDVVVRSRRRTYERQRRGGTIRFWVLALSLVGTAVAVTVGMFVSLYYLLG